MTVADHQQFLLHEKVFWAVSFFLVGVLLASGIGAWQQRTLFAVGISFLIALGLFLFNKKWLAVLSLAVLIGAHYYFWFDSRYQHSFNAPIGQSLTLTGLVEKVTTSDTSQAVDLTLRSPYQGKIRVTADLYPTISYGDVLSMNGTLKAVSEQSQNYYAKEGLSAVLSFPKKVMVLETGRGSNIKSTLFALRDRVQDSFKRVLPPDEATFMTGLTLGKSAGFSKEFKQKLSDTGTTHLVALSGYNISVIATGIALLLGFWFSRRVSFMVGVTAIILFVIMTGAEASVVRAAIMAIIILVADRSGRVFVVKNAIVIAAFLMVLVNPRVLVFDIGFQLSFFALLGIVYLQPALARLFNAKEEKGFLNWRANLMTTLAAQLAVLPILLSSFGFFSILSILVNLLILTFVPLTMLFGLLIFFSSLLTYYLSLAIAFIARILLRYELSVINLFAHIPFGVRMQGFSLAVGTLYYAILVGFILIQKRRQTQVI